MKRAAFYLLTIAGLFTSLIGTAQVQNNVKWKFSAESVANGDVVLHFTANIDREWHMYGLDLPEGGPQSTEFTFKNKDGYKLVGKINFTPAPTVVYDDVFKLNVKYFTGKADFTQKIIVGNAKTVEGNIAYQTCKEGTCMYSEQNFSIALPENKTAIASSNTIADTSAKTAVAEVKADTAKAVVTAAKPTSKDTKSMGGFILLAILTGFGALLTPCVFPMIPMTVSFFMSKQTSKASSILNAAVFGFSIILTYTLLGVIVSLPGVGSDITNQITSSWITNLIFGVLFLVFAASLFGVFEIVLPGSLASKADSKAEKGGLIGSFFLGLTTVIVSLSCVGPFVGALLVQSATGVSMRPIIGMFSFSVAFALPFVVLAAFPSLLKNLPKSGGWLNAVKVVMGFILLAFSLQFFLVIDSVYHWNILTREIFLSLWIAIFSMLGLYLLGKIKFKLDSETKHIGFFRLILAILTFSFVVYLIPGLFGAPLKALSGLIPNEGENAAFYEKQASPAEAPNNATKITAKYSDILRLPFGLQGYFDYDEALAAAKLANKPLFIDFVGHTCRECKKMDGQVLSDPRIIQRLRDNFVVVALYVDEPATLPTSELYTSKLDGLLKSTLGEKNKDIQVAKFGLNGQPYYIITDQDEKPLGDPHSYDLSIDNFIQFLDNGKKIYEMKHSAGK
ncbi:MAG TPA: cytochrome c biogenesis protein CcdA [Williamwhitmania sp.]|nr:cytochrome c biogenesis protein CcdA [Williamwhitmania sp.]